MRTLSPVFLLLLAIPSLCIAQPRVVHMYEVDKLDSDCLEALQNLNALTQATGAVPKFIINVAGGGATVTATFDWNHDDGTIIYFISYINKRTHHKESYDLRLNISKVIISKPISLGNDVTEFQFISTEEGGISAVVSEQNAILKLGIEILVCAGGLHSPNIAKLNFNLHKLQKALAAIHEKNK